MILLDCPWCGYRNVSEFHSTGELVPRPDPESTTREEWRTYLYIRQNPAGRVEEGWYHRAGCRRYFEAVRDTTDNTVFETRPPGATARGRNPVAERTGDLSEKGVRV